jgi:hypothetical protein
MGHCVASDRLVRVTAHEPLGLHQPGIAARGGADRARFGSGGPTKDTDQNLQRAWDTSVWHDDLERRFGMRVSILVALLLISACSIRSDRVEQPRPATTTTQQTTTVSPPAGPAVTTTTTTPSR